MGSIKISGGHRIIGGLFDRAASVFVCAVLSAGCVLTPSRMSSQAVSSGKLREVQQNEKRVALSAAEVSQLQTKAEAGDVAAQLELGKAYLDGNGLPQNDVQAAKWYRQAAELGDAGAQNELGLMYRLGQGVSQNKEEAVRWYSKAAKQGNATAMFN